MVAVDEIGEGAPATRNRAWRQSTAPYVAFLDDDDELLPHHLEKLAAALDKYNADVAYSRYRIVFSGKGRDDLIRFGQHPPKSRTPEIDDLLEVVANIDNYVLGQPWRVGSPIHPQVTCVWRREALEDIGGFHGVGEEDLNAFDALAVRGGTFVFVPEVTWLYYRHDGVTLGQPGKQVFLRLPGPLPT